MPKFYPLQVAGFEIDSSMDGSCRESFTCIAGHGNFKSIQRSQFNGQPSKRIELINCRLGQLVLEGKSKLSKIEAINKAMLPLAQYEIVLSIKNRRLLSRSSWQESS